MFKGDSRKLLVGKQNCPKPGTQESSKRHLHVLELLPLLLISSLPRCRLTCVPTNQRSFHVYIQDKHIKNMSCGGVGPHAKHAGKSSAQALLEALFSCQESGPWKMFSIVKAIAGEGSASSEWWRMSHAWGSCVKNRTVHRAVLQCCILHCNIGLKDKYFPAAGCKDGVRLHFIDSESSLEISHFCVATGAKDVIVTTRQ